MFMDVTKMLMLGPLKAIIAKGKQIRDKALLACVPIPIFTCIFPVMFSAIILINVL